MVPARLSPRQQTNARSARPNCALAVRRTAAAYSGLWALTAAGATLGRAWPAIAPAGTPHPTLHGTLGDALAIATTNTRILSAPFGLAILGFPADRRARRLGDVLVAGLLAANAIHVGLALGRDGAQLVRYVPQLPIEWLAAAITAAAWLELRNNTTARPAGRYAVAALAAVAIAATIETAVTPHAATAGCTAAARKFTVSPARVAGSGGCRTLIFADRRPGAARSHGFLPLAITRFRWPPAGTSRRVNHRIPTRREPR
jgi:hypothetical protein